MVFFKKKDKDKNGTTTTSTTTTTSEAAGSAQPAMVVEQGEEKIEKLQSTNSFDDLDTKFAKLLGALGLPLEKQSDIFFLYSLAL
jgi:hypothetical protein